MSRSTRMGGGRVVRAVGRAVGSGIAGVKDAVSATAGVKTVKLAQVVPLASSSGLTESSSEAVVFAAAGCSTVCFSDGDEWVAVEDVEEGMEMEEGTMISKQFERFVFGPVPSTQEAKEAVSTIQRMFLPVSLETENYPFEQLEIKEKSILSAKLLPRSLSTGSQSDWIEPAMHLYSCNARHSEEREKVLDAFRLLQINPSIQRVVLSLASDSDVWDAVMKNEVIQEFKKSFYSGESKPQDSDKGPQSAHGIKKWIVDAKTKFMEVLDKISKQLNQAFRPYNVRPKRDALHDALRSSFMLSVLVFIVVTMKRARKC